MHQILFNSTTFEPIAAAYLRAHVKRMMKALDELELIDLSTDLTQKELEIAFQILFFDALQAESFNQIEVDGIAYLPTLTFAKLEGTQTGVRGPTASKTFVASDKRKELHGNVSDELLISVARELRDEP